MSHLIFTPEALTWFGIATATALALIPVLE